MVLFGSAAGNSDYGRSYIRKAATADTLYIGLSSEGTRDGEVALADNIYITVLDLFTVISKTPKIILVGTSLFSTGYKDGDLAYVDQTSLSPPVANAGSAVAATIDSGTSLITVNFDALSGAHASFATADGASLSSYLWDVRDGTITVGVATDSAISATFPAGFRWISLTVTDSNGKTHTCYVPVYARDPAADDGVSIFNETQLHVTAKGQELAVKILSDIPYGTYPDGTLVLLWDGEPAGAADRTNVKFCGWHQADAATIAAQRTGTLQDTVLTCLDALSKLDTLPAFPQSIESKATPDSWLYMASPNMDKYLHYLLMWHSNILDLADWTWTGTGTAFAFYIQTSQGGSLYQQVEEKAAALTPDYHLTCNRLGQLACKVDPMLQDTADRTSTYQATITEADWSNIRYTHTRPPKVGWLNSGAVIASASSTIQTVFSRAPGDAPGQGLELQDHNIGLTPDQTTLNHCEGHRYARLNAAQSTLTITFADGNDRAIEPANMEWVRVTIPASLAAQRGGAGSLMRGLPKELTISYDTGREGTVQSAEMIWEREVDGEPAVTYIQPEVNAPPPDNWGGWVEPPLTSFTPPPAILVESQRDVAAIINQNGGGIVVAVTSDFTTPASSGGPSWTHTIVLITGAGYTWVVDPFSPLYVDGSGTVDGWLATKTAIYRITDLFGSPVATSVYTFADSTNVGGRNIRASFGKYFAEGSNPWLMCVSYYYTGTSVGTTVVYSTDAGVTWSSEIQLTSFYDSLPIQHAYTPGLYMSPKTPGLALTFGHSGISYRPPGIPYITRDFGATWAELAEGDPLYATPGQSLGNGFHVPWPDNDDEVLFYCHFRSNSNPIFVPDTVSLQNGTRQRTPPT